MNATAVIDTADILLAQPITVAPGETIDFSGTALSVDFTPIAGGGVVMSASSADGTLAFVGGATPYFRIDLPVAGRTWRIARPTAVRGDILRRPDPANPAQVEWLGRVDLTVNPGSNSPAIALKAQAPILGSIQPYDGRIVTAPMIVGPQGPPSRETTEAVAVTGLNTLAPLSKTPNGAALDLYVYGLLKGAVTVNPAYSVLGKQIIWLATKAAGGFDLEPGDPVQVRYTY